MSAQQDDPRAAAAPTARPRGPRPSPLMTAFGVMLVLSVLVSTLALLAGPALPGWALWALGAGVVALTLTAHAVAPRGRRTLDGIGIDPAITGEPREEQPEPHHADRAQ